MRRTRRSGRPWALLALACAHCSSSPPPPEPAEAPAPPAPPPSAAEAPASPAPEAVAPAAPSAAPLPSACASGAEKGLCVPDAAFVERLCAADFPDVALALLAKGTPFTRGYLRRDVETWDVAGRGHAAVKLQFDEEVLVLEKRAAPEGGMQVSGATGGYRVMRWDGRCATLDSAELTLRPPPRAKAAPIAWKYLDGGTKDALLGVGKIRSVYEGRQKECGGAQAEPGKRCERLEAQLSGAVVEFLRGGGKIPEPPRRP
jgi:hypothetical protein